MNTIPDNLPPLPEGAVYLGRGHTFKTAGGYFSGWSFNPSFPESGWSYYAEWAGSLTVLHFAAPADSEIAKLNDIVVEAPIRFGPRLDVIDTSIDLDPREENFEERELALVKWQAAALNAEAELERVVKENLRLRQEVADKRLNGFEAVPVGGMPMEELLKHRAAIFSGETQPPCPSENPFAMPDQITEDDEKTKLGAAVVCLEVEASELRSEIEALRACLSKAVRLGDELVQSVEELGNIEDCIDFDAKRERLEAWEAFKASVGGDK